MRSQTPYPAHVNLDFLETIKNFGETGVLNDYSENHFLIRIINNDISYFKDLFQRRNIRDIDPGIFSWNFILNLDGKIKNFINRFGNVEIEHFFKNQFAAGKSSYNENQFFEALSEFHVLSFSPISVRQCYERPYMSHGWEKARLLNPGGPIAQSKRNRCSIPPV